MRFEWLKSVWAILAALFVGILKALYAPAWAEPVAALAVSAMHLVQPGVGLDLGARVVIGEMLKGGMPDLWDLWGLWGLWGFDGSYPLRG